MKGRKRLLPLEDTLDSLSPSCTSKNPGSFDVGHRDGGEGDALVTFDYRELKEVCSLIKDKNLLEVVKATEQPKPFAAFGSYRQRYGDTDGLLSRKVPNSRISQGLSSEAPAKLGSGLHKNFSEQRENFGQRRNSILAQDFRASAGTLSEPIDIKIDGRGVKEGKFLRGLQKQRSISSDIDRDEAWERKRDLYMMEEQCDLQSRSLGRCVSDCDERTLPRSSAAKPSSRTRGLTDEDLEELRGCIDLGFGFGHDESENLKSTLPALDLYCAINRQYNDLQSRSSPLSSLDSAMVGRSSSTCSPGSPLSDTWRISSPGDHPSEVKTRLRHWAQAVACSIKQRFS